MDKEKEEIFEGKWYTHPSMRNALIAGLITGIGFVLGHLDIISHTAEISFYVIAIVLGGYFWVKEGLEELFHDKEVGIEILMLAATIGSAILGLWNEAAFLVFLFGAAEGLEEYTFAKTRASIRKLLDLAPKEACILKDGKETMIPATEIKVNDVFIVRPGESMPTDGVIIEGVSSINEAPVTGESIPVEKKEGMKVFAATINHESILMIKTTAAFEDNTLSKMIHLVEEAQEQKGKTQLFIEKFGKRYSPLVLFSALLFIAVPHLLGIETTEWANRAVVLLVAAAPCALVMSTPVAIAAGIGKAGQSGILIKGGIHLENLGKIKVIAFDKTGTLTAGKPIVTDIIAVNADRNDVLKLAYAVEKSSEHPLAKAIVSKAEELGISDSSATVFKAIIGGGAKAVVNGRDIYVGKPELFNKIKLGEKESKQLEKLRGEGKTSILVGTETEIKGIIAIQDEIRPQARQVIAELHRLDIKTIMLTGDNDLVAKTIAAKIGIDDVKANLKPEEKIKAIEALEKEYGAVAMVGDGINDAPALARATVGIAMGTVGTDAAIEAANVALMADDLSKLLYAIQLGKKALAISKQNIVFSLLILIALIPSAVIGVMSVAIAVIFHEVSELLAVANGLRMVRVHDSTKTTLTKGFKTIIPVTLMLSFSLPSFSQSDSSRHLTIDDAIRIALQNNPQVKSSTLAVDQQKALKKTSFSLPKTNFSITSGQINTPARDNYYGVTQDISFPSVYFRQNQVQNQNITLSNKSLVITQNELIRNVRSAYYQLDYIDELLRLLSYQDSIYKRFSEKAELKYKTGESSYLELLAAKNKYAEVQLQRKEAESQKAVYTQEMQKLLNITYTVSFVYTQFEKLSLTITTDTTAISQNPALAYYNQKIVLANSELILEKSRLLPDFSLGYWNQSIDGVKGFQGVELGIGIPIFFWGQQGRVQSAEIQTQMAQSDYENFQNNLKTLFDQNLQEYQTLLNELSYYEDTGLKQADEILKVAVLAYQKGEIGYVEYIQNLTQAVTIRTQYLQTVNQLNQTVISINYLTGK